MKQLKDGTFVPARCYYYLLSYNDEVGKAELLNRYGTSSLADLSNAQFWAYFSSITHKEAHDVFLAKQNESKG